MFVALFRNPNPESIRKTRNNRKLFIQLSDVNAEKQKHKKHRCDG